MTTRTWGHIEIAQDEELVQRGTIKPGDVVHSSHFGRAQVTRVEKVGETSYLYLEGRENSPEAYPLESHILRVNLAWNRYTDEKLQKDLVDGLPGPRRAASDLLKLETAKQRCRAVGEARTLMNLGITSRYSEGVNLATQNLLSLIAKGQEDDGLFVLMVEKIEFVQTSLKYSRVIVYLNNNFCTVFDSDQQVQLQRW